MSLWDRLLDRPQAAGHLVQFYDSETQLVRRAGHYLLQGIRQSEGVIIVADPWHREMFLDYLEGANVDTAEAEESGQLLLLDARRTLDSLLRNGQPDWKLFQAVAANILSQVRPRTPGGGLRAWGEMVGLLWKNHQYSAAIRLEQFWNKVLGDASFSIFCGYNIDVFGRDFAAGPVDDLLCSHSHLIPGAGRHVDESVVAALTESGYDLQTVARQVGSRSDAWAVMPRGEALILGLRRAMPREADAILARARLIHKSAQVAHSPMRVM